MLNKSAIIVGAGIIGCSLASELARRGCKVTVLDAGQSGSGTTAASFAWVNSNNKEPAEYSRLNHLGLQAHERWAAVRSSQPWFHQTGNIEVATDEAVLEVLKEKLGRMREQGYNAQLLNLKQLQELEPGIDFGTAAGGGTLRPRGMGRRHGRLS